MDQIISAGRDPVGKAQLKNNKVLRGVYKQYAQFYKSVLENSSIQSMLGKQIIETQPAIKNLAEYGLTLEHPLITPRNYAYEWPLVMLQDAAILTLDICLKLNQEGMVLKDATPWNIQFRSTQPLLVDFSSIMPLEKDLLWVAYDQFMRTFLFPLLVGYYTSGQVARALLLSNQNGIPPQLTKRFLPWYARSRFFWIVKRLGIPLFLVNLLHRTGQEKEITKLQTNVVYTKEQRESFFQSIKKDVSTIKFGGSKSMWSQYYQNMDTFFRPEKFHLKQTKVAELLAKVKPKTVVDMGCNVGGYAILAADAGAKVAAFDTDEESIAMLYMLAKEKSLDILPLVANVLYPSPACGWRAEEFPTLQERLRSELGLALALEHHLAISQNQSFEQIAQTFSDYCQKRLITEFVPIDDPRVQELLLTSRRDMSWYTLENFQTALKQQFSHIELFPSYPKGRTLIFCEK